LAAAIVDPMRLANEGDNHVFVGGFVQQDFGVAGRDDLRSSCSGGLREE
jgi:hypothetical protein